MAASAQTLREDKVEFIERILEVARVGQALEDIKILNVECLLSGIPSVTIALRGQRISFNRLGWRRENIGMGLDFLTRDTVPEIRAFFAITHVAFNGIWSMGDASRVDLAAYLLKRLQRDKLTCYGDPRYLSDQRAYCKDIIVQKNRSTVKSASKQ